MKPEVSPLPERWPQAIETSVAMAPSPANRTARARPSAGYADHGEHLWHALERVDQLVRAHVIRWRAGLAAYKPSDWWGMLTVTEGEVDAFLAHPFAMPVCLPHYAAEEYSAHVARAETIEAAIEGRLAATPSSVDLRLHRLQRTFGLSAYERDLLLICLLPELDARYRRLYSYLMDDASRSRATVELVTALLAPMQCDAAQSLAALHHSAPLRMHRLAIVEGGTEASEPPTQRSVRLDDRIESFLAGSDLLDGRLVGIAAFTPPTNPETTAETANGRPPAGALQAVTKLWRRQHARGSGMTLLLHGPPGSGRAAAGAALAQVTGTALLVVDVTKALESPVDWETTVALCFREAQLQGGGLAFHGAGALWEEGQPAGRRRHLLQAAEKSSSLTILECEAAWEPSEGFRDQPFRCAELPRPDFGERHRIWQGLLPSAEALGVPESDRDALATGLANSFRLTAGQMHQALNLAWCMAEARFPAHRKLQAEDCYEGCRRLIGRQLPRYARRIPPRSGLVPENLVLPPTTARQIEELRHRARRLGLVYHQLGFGRHMRLGQGLIALFTGASGTGKTLAAEVVASACGLDLYKVDLSTVVSKYVGETEQHLNLVFEEAEAANAMLLFDECDALFGKRGEVKHGQDRWANMEVNYLLQRVEEYAGVVILTSNLRQNIDEAFIRRIHMVVDFPFPDAESRYRILAGLLPKDIKSPAEKELRAVSERFHVAGGAWRNIALDALFRSLSEDGKGTLPLLTVRHLVASVAREYQKHGRPVTASEFGTRYYAWAMEDILCPRAVRTAGEGPSSGRRPRQP